MKKAIIASMFFAWMAFQTSAQLSIGIHGGGGLFKFEATNSQGDEVEGFKLAPRFNAGIIAEFSFVNDLALQTGLVYAGKGSTLSIVIPDIMSLEYKFFLNYLEIPLYFVYKTPAAGGRFFVGSGPYLGFGLNGTMKQRLDNDPEETFEVVFAREHPFGEFDKIYFKPLDFGLNTIAGYQHNSGLFAGLNAQVGFANIFVPFPEPTKAEDSKSVNDKTSRKNLGFSLNIGFRF